MRTYGRLLRHPPTALSLLAALVGAVPIGMWPLAIVLGVLDGGGSAADAGLQAAVFGIGNAIGVVSQGALLARVRASRAPARVRRCSASSPPSCWRAAWPRRRGPRRSRDPGGDAGGARPVRELAARARPAGRVRARERAVPGRDRDRPAHRRGARGRRARAVGAAPRRRRRPARRGAPRRRASRPAPGRRAAPADGGGPRRGVDGRPRAARRRDRGRVRDRACCRCSSRSARVRRPRAPRSPCCALAEVAGAVLVGGRVGPRHAFRLLVGGAAAMALVYVLLGAGVGRGPGGRRARPRDGRAVAGLGDRARPLRAAGTGARPSTPSRSRC